MYVNAAIKKEDIKIEQLEICTSTALFDFAWLAKPFMAELVGSNDHFPGSNHVRVHIIL